MRRSAIDKSRCPGLFIIGTDTGVGKTHLTCAIARLLHRQGVRVGVYKPVCSGQTSQPDGVPNWPDIAALAQAVDHRFDDDRICPQRFVAATAPPAAAVLEQRSVDSDLLRTGADWWTERVDLLLVEGMGGLLCPLTESETVADLAVDFKMPLLVVSRLELGMINHTLLTLEVACSRGLRIAGVIANQVDPQVDRLTVESSLQEISHRADVPILAVTPHQEPDALSGSESLSTIDWNALAST